MVCNNPIVFSHSPRELDPFKVLYDMSQLLGTQLDKETLATCIGMIESGVNPEALAVSLWFFYMSHCIKLSLSGCNPRTEERGRCYSSKDECGRGRWKAVSDSGEIMISQL